jgi:trans-aconitate 2-methyltransferase
MTMNWNAADYARNSQGQFAWALKRLEHLRLADDAVVLDVGCGDGKVTAQLAMRVPHGRIIGIDNSKDMIELAKRTWTDKISNMEFHVADAQSLDLPSQFDLAFSNEVLHWAPNHPAVLRGVAAALKPDGHLVFTMGGRGTAAAVYNAIAELAQTDRWSPFLTGARSPHYFYDVEKYNEWLSQSGFSPTHLVLVPKPMRLADIQALEGWLRTTWGTYTGRIPEGDRSAFLTDLTERVYAGCDTDEDGTILLPMISLEVDAVKVVA